MIGNDFSGPRKLRRNVPADHVGTRGNGVNHAGRTRSAAGAFGRLTRRSADVPRSKNPVVHPGQRQQAPDDTKVIEVKISLPQLGAAKARAGRIARGTAKMLRHSRRQLGIIAGVVLIGAIGVIGWQVYGDRQASSGATASEAASQAGSDKGPAYDTLLPEGKTIEQLGGWGRVSPPDKPPAYAFIDSFKGTQLSVSQQALPEAFKADVAGSVSKLAAQFSAKESVKVGDTPVYIGTSAKGPQSVMFVRDELLVLIKSSSKLANEDWQQYIANLK